MDLSKLWEIASKSLKIGLPSMMLGALVTYLIFDSVVLSGKNNQIANLNAVVEVEKGHQNVLNERIKLLGDKAVFLEGRIKYKPQIEKEKHLETQQEITRLQAENKYLQSVKSKLENLEGDRIEVAKIEVKLENYVAEITRLKTVLSKYESDIIIENYRLEVGNGWSGFGGKVTFGLGRTDFTGSDGNIAIATSSMFSENSKKVKAGDRFEFSIGENKYYLVVSGVHYIGSYIEISVYKI